MPVLLLAGVAAVLGVVLASSASAAELDAPATVLPGVGPGGTAAESSVATDVVTGIVTGGVVGGAIAGVSALIQNAEDRKARIAAEGTWSGQIRAFIAGLPPELVRGSSVMEMAISIVHQYGFGGAWRTGIPDPVLGMRMVLTSTAQQTENLRAINFTYQDALRRAYGVGDALWLASIANTGAGLVFNPIIGLGLQPHASEMTHIVLTGGLG
jgi:hypothetical protein